jgi:hypothetical protein
MEIAPASAKPVLRESTRRYPAQLAAPEPKLRGRVTPGSIMRLVISNALFLRVGG